MIDDDSLDKLAKILYEAYYSSDDDWEAFKESYPTLAAVWRHVAKAAINTIVVVKIKDI